MQPRVLVVEDEAAIADMIALNLRHRGFYPVIAKDIDRAQKELDAVLPDVVLLDWMLPGHGAVQNGLMLAKKWRSQARSKEVPILMLTARSEELDRVAGLEAGADDYVLKPFSMQELVARIRAVLRRRKPQAAQELLRVGALELDPLTHRVRCAGQELRMAPTEYKLLQFLMTQPERVHARTQLQDKVWGDHVFIEDRTVDVHIKRLRQALGALASMIETVRGAGYRLNPLAACVAALPSSPLDSKGPV